MAVDAGSGDAGDVTVRGCWFEACFHEGMAWSGEGREVNVSDSVVMNSGQGIRSGLEWRIEYQQSDCQCHGLAVRGEPHWLALRRQLRLGTTTGSSMSPTRSHSSMIATSGGFEWDSWNYRSEKMTIENNKLSEADSRNPANTVWDGAIDGALLAPLAPVAGALPRAVDWASGRCSCR